MMITFPMFLGLTFVVLKLTKVIAWSWWWITCPFWAGLVIVMLLTVWFGTLTWLTR